MLRSVCVAAGLAVAAAESYAAGGYAVVPEARHATHRALQVRDATAYGLSLGESVRQRALLQCFSCALCSQARDESICRDDGRDTLTAESGTLSDDQVLSRSLSLSLSLSLARARSLPPSLCPKATA